MPHNDGVAERVWKFLDQDPSIRMNIARKIMNIRALAMYIIQETKIDSSVDGVISAIRRYDVHGQERIFEKAREIIKKTSTISTKSRVVNISVIKDSDIQEKLPRLFSIIRYNQGDVLRVIQADESIKILIDEKNLESVKNIFSSDKILRIDQNLAEISVHMHPDARAVPGVLAISALELAIHNINLLEAMSCFPEWLWFVDEKDLLKAYHVLHQLWQG
jgi:aspartokinase